jgi:hypothetical protein
MLDSATAVTNDLYDGLWKRYAYERHAYEMAYERCTLMRDTPVGWLL